MDPTSVAACLHSKNSTPDNIMKHPYLHPVDPGTNNVPVCYDRLQSWINRLPAWLADPSIPKPKATLLCGLPGTGKGNSVKAIARVLQRPLFRLDPACDRPALAEITTLLTQHKTPCVLWADQPGEVHAGMHRWLLDNTTQPAFVVFTTDTPQKLPAGFTRADVVESAWHLDLPGTRQRSALWGELLAAAYTGHHENDSVKLAQISPMFTAGEIHAAFEHAHRECGRLPDEGHLIDAVLRLRPVGCSMDEQLACLRAWALTHACVAASTIDHAEP